MINNGNVSPRSSVSVANNRNIIRRNNRCTSRPKPVIPENISPSHIEEELPSPPTSSYYDKVPESPKPVSPTVEDSFIFNIINFLPIVVSILIILAGLSGIQFFINNPDSNLSTWKDISALFAGFGGGIMVHQIISIMRKYITISIMPSGGSISELFYLLMILVIVVVIGSLASGVLTITESIKNGENIKYLELIEMLTYSTIGFLTGVVASIGFGLYSTSSKSLVFRSSIMLYSVIALFACLISFYIYVSTESESTEWVIILMGVMISTLFCIGITFVPSMITKID